MGSTWEKVVSFHGHACCILAVGYRASLLALEKLKPAAGERLVAVVETLDCSTDAVQVVLGCTMGSRRLVVKETGKYALTLANPDQAVRVVLRPGIINKFGPDFAEIMGMVANSTATPEVRERFYAEQKPLMDYILEAPAGELFLSREIDFTLPPPSFAFKSIVCSSCGEEVFSSYTTCHGDRVVCISCLPGGPD